MSDSRMQTTGVKVQRSCGERFRKALIELGLFDRNRRITSDEGHVYLPVFPLNDDAQRMLRKISGFEIIEADFKLEERNLSPEEILGFRPGFEVVGDIAIVEPEDAEKVKEIADVLMSLYRSIKTVITPVSDVEGEFRTRRFRHIAGQPRTTTIHKEHGLRYCIDLEGAYFSPRLGTERLRVARQIHPGDVVLDMFAGVGPFALLLAKKGANVVAIDKNPVATRCLRKNAQLNKVHAEILEGDSADLALRYENAADHVIMNLPHSTSQFLAPAIRAAKSGGVVHYYSIASVENLYADTKLIKNAASSIGASVEIQYQGIVRSYAPKRYNIVIDFRLIKP
ncbi:MAG: class I SAM-dependent methyltransferase family protein [Methanotrichaceae archaeon]